VAIDRRRFLRSSAALVGLAGAAGCAGVAAPHPGAAPRAEGESPFRHGVASGDPLAHRVILWTRISPTREELRGEIRVEWWIARDPDARDVVRRGEAFASADRDFTIKVDADGLEPGAAYHYGFVCEGAASPVGRTRTLPGDDASALRFALVSCANYPQGFFHAYACIAGLDALDAVIHVGDYLYELGEGEYGDGLAIGRGVDPVHEIVSLEDYRRRHALYKTDPDLQAAHARHPWISVWDDHEIANDAWREGAENHQPGEGDFGTRKLAAIRAYQEWMPIRDLPTGLFRRFRFGGLADLVMLDGRLHGRDRKVDAMDQAGARDPSRTLLGADQTRWLLDALAQSKHDGIAWRIVGQQVVFSTLVNGEERFNPDAWDGYRANRGQILAALADAAIDDVVVLTGDVHSAWAIDVPDSEVPGAVYDPATGRGARALEIVAPAVTSLPLWAHEGAREVFPDPEKTLAHVRFADLEHNGFVLLELSRERLRAEFFAIDSVRVREAACRAGAVLEARAGTNHFVRVGAGA